MKKVVGILMAVILVMSMAACGSSGESTSTKAKDEETKTEAGKDDTKADASESDDQGDVKIGLICGLTGSQPLEGLRTQQAVQMAIDEINAAGGVLGGRKLVLQTEDDQLTADTSVVVMTKLCEDEDVVAVMGPGRTANVLACDETISKYGIPALVSGTAVSINELENENIFRIRACDTIFASNAAKFAVEELGCKKIGIMYNNDDFGNGGKVIIEDYLKENHPDVEVVAEGHNTGDTDMTGQLLNLKDAGCDCMITWTNGAESIVIARQFRELGMDTSMEFIGSAGIGNAEFYETVEEDVADGVYGVVDFVRDNPDVADFVKNFYDRYNENAELGGSAYYDGTYILAAAIDRAGSTDREAIAAALRETDYTGNQGHMYCDEGQNMVHQCVVYQYDGLEQKAITTVKEDE